MLRPLIRSATTGSGVDGNVIDVLNQPDGRRRCLKVGQIVIEERWRQNASLYHSCFHLSAFRFSLPKINFGSSVLHIVVEPATDCCRLDGVEDTMRRMQPARGRFARFDLDRQMASTLPAHWKVGPAPVFGASQPLEPAEWLALLILKAGDVESNPGPQNRKLPPSALTTQTTTLNSTTHSHATTSHPNQKLLTLLQLNINSITNKHEELKLLVTELQPDIITIQETKLKKHNKTPQIPTYSAIRTDRANGKGGGLLTYIKHNITFSDTKIPNFINPINTELKSFNYT